MSQTQTTAEIIIRRVPLFAALPEEETRYLAENLRQHEFPAQTILFREGEIGDLFSIIVEGQVEIVKALGTPEARILARLGPGEFIGEMSLLFPDRQRSASARASAATRLLAMTQADFHSLLSRRPELALLIMQEMSMRMRNSENATIRDLQEVNQHLSKVYQELKDAQARLIEQEKIEHELNMARKIQTSMLPKHLPALPGWRLAAHWQPARAVSGDFYDFVEYPDGKLGLVVGDVTDKGVPAALMMAVTRSVLHSVGEQSDQPGAVLRRVNDLLVRDMPANMFVTCLYAVLDPASGRLRFANAGHDLPYLCRGETIAELRATGMPLGLMPGMSYDEKEASLEPGDTLLLYSDGLVEAHNPEQEMFGFPRLAQALADRPRPPLENGSADEDACAALIRYLLDQLASFTGPGWEQEDDVTCVVLEWEARSAGAAT